MIKSNTLSHLVGYFYMVYTMMHKYINIKFTTKMFGQRYPNGSMWYPGYNGDFWKLMSQQCPLYHSSITQLLLKILILQDH